MKHFYIILLTLCLLLCACGKDSTETQPSTEPTETTEVTESTEHTEATEATEPTDVTEGTETTEPVVQYRHPLTGQLLEEAWIGQVNAIVINNIQDALPHYGVSKADMIYEIETEGGITRMLALYTDFTDVGKIGPVRSDRSFFNNVAVSFDAPLFHCGGSRYGLNGNYDDSGNVIPNWKHIDARYYEGTYFFRDNDRYNLEGYAWEHTLFTDGGRAQKALEQKALYQPVSRDFGLAFTEESQLQGDTANEITVTFRGGKTSRFTYNAETELFDMSQYGKSYVDAEYDQQMSFKNVLVVYSDQWFIYDGTYNRSFYDLLGSGQGLAAIDGKVVPITWHRESLNDPFTYTLEDGSELILGVGKTYVAVASPIKPATYQ
ncbi:MAG: DUF3048 domain-containing protein [Oscillospiraceae bacterium]|nr:DUF3048 domain-containing protein [Oscillospiraceae bacterium]